MTSHFIVGNEYTRSDVLALLGLPDQHGGDWDTGYAERLEAFFVFCNVGVAGRTGHDYKNRWDGDKLIWFAKGPTKITDKQIQRLLAPAQIVHVFWRSDDRDPFTYAGIGTPTEPTPTTPVKVTFVFLASNERHDERSPSEVVGATYPEGAVNTILVNAYERNPAARRDCLRHHGTACAVCSLDFEHKYGAVGRGFVHVHHLRPLPTLPPNYVVNPVTDLVPVCPNCHAMLHRANALFPLTPDELRMLIAQQQGAHT